MPSRFLVQNAEFRVQNFGSATLLYFYHTDFTNVGDGSPVPNEIAKNLRETERLPYDDTIGFIL